MSIRIRAPRKLPFTARNSIDEIADMMQICPDTILSMSQPVSFSFLSRLNKNNSCDEMTGFRKTMSRAHLLSFSCGECLYYSSIVEVVAFVLAVPLQRRVGEGEGCCVGIGLLWPREWVLDAGRSVFLMPVDLFCGNFWLSVFFCVDFLRNGSFRCHFGHSLWMCAQGPQHYSRIC